MRLVLVQCMGLLHGGQFNFVLTVLTLFDSMFNVSVHMQYFFFF